jgi:hypothetical protein
VKFQCIVCESPHTCPNALCSGCKRSYDAWNARATGDMMALIKWAAQRALKVERKRVLDGY